MFSKDKPIKILTFGDSLTQGNPPPNRYHPNKYQYWMRLLLEKEGFIIDDINYGIGGQIMGEISRRVPDSLFHNADFISIAGGTNDVWRYSNFDEEMSSDMRNGVLEEMEDAVNHAKNGPNGDIIKIILCSVPPIIPLKSATMEAHENVIKLRPEIEKLAKKMGVYYCDIYKSMCDEKGYARSELVIMDGVHFTEAGLLYRIHITH